MWLYNIESPKELDTDDYTELVITKKHGTNIFVKLGVTEKMLLPSFFVIVTLFT